jgi:hypothetical protein
MAVKLGFDGKRREGKVFGASHILFRRRLPR